MGRPAASSAESKARKALGVWLRTVTPSRTTREWNASAERAVCAGTITSRPPVQERAPELPHRSRGDGMEESQTSSAPKPNSASVVVKSRAALCCVTHTPFGRPVEPEV